MLNIGDEIDDKYRVTKLCSNSGGMGTIFHVESIGTLNTFPIVLKICKAMDADSKTRFQREVRYLSDFSGNPRIVQVLDSNLTFYPPYFIMKYYPDGDLTRVASVIRTDVAKQEELFNRMLDCIGELHSKSVCHRDIKPQNFLLDGVNVIASDLGLAKMPGAGTTLTESHEYWGTQGYLPPEFCTGFKDPVPQSDIFMLGKTFYWLLTGRDPAYVTDLDLPPAIFHVIERCCDMKLSGRYDSVASLRQDLKLAFDVILRRADGLGAARQKISQIVADLNSAHKYDATEVNDFLDLLAKLSDKDRSRVLTDLPPIFYQVLAQQPCESKLGKFLEQYETFVQDAVGTWSYSETVASNMKILFEKATPAKYRARALEIAVMGGSWANRFAAMDTCKDLVKGVADETLGVAVAAMIRRIHPSFLDNIDPSQCLSDAVRNALRPQIPTTAISDSPEQGRGA